MAGTKRRARRFRLGPPGAAVRVEYAISTTWDRVSSIVLGAGLVCSAVVLFGVHKAFAVGLAVGGLLALASGLRKRLGVIAVDGSYLDIGPQGRSRRVALSEVVGTSRATTGVVTGEREDLLVRFVDPKAPGKVGLGVARLKRSEADELAVRLALRARAARTGDAQMVEALEALHLAGDEAIGVVRVGKEWRPFSSTDELEGTVLAHPFRDRARLSVCVSATVWEALSSIPSIRDRLEAVVVPE